MLRALDFGLRLLFFATIPFVVTIVATLFPITGVLVNIALTLIVFAFAEALRPHAEASPLLRRLSARHFAFEAYYRENPPRPFLFYVFYPAILPYVLSRPLLRRELLLYRGLTGGGVAILLVLAVIDFFRHWSPELGVAQFFPVWIAVFLVQTLAILVFLLPIATTVVKLHSERRVRELWVLFGAAAISIGLGVAAIVHHRGHVVSWVTTRRVMMRTLALPADARAAQLTALEAVRDNYDELVASTDAEGWVESDAGERAEDALGAFYKSDEAYAFSLHAFPPTAPEVILLQCWIRGHDPVWRAIRRDGSEITDRRELPRGILGLKPRKEKKPGTRAKTPAHSPAKSPRAVPRPPTTPSAAPKKK
jgi:hypothetical protein